MIQINGNCYVGVELEGLADFNRKIFTKLVIKESAGLIPPIFELHLFQNTYSLYSSITKVNLPIKISYGTSLTNARTYKFTLSNYVYAPAEGGYNLILTGMMDVKDFTNISRIRAFKMTSDMVIDQIDSLTPSTNYTGMDEQSWIQHNISDKTFVENIISHAYVDDTDVIAGAITIDKQLIINSVKNVFAKDVTRIIRIKQEVAPHEINQSIIKFDGLQVESDSALWSNFLSEGKELPVFSIEDRTITPMKPITNSIIDGTSYQSYTQNVSYPTIIDCGNCHDKYYQAWVNNLNYLVQFSRNNIYITTTQKYLSTEIARVLDAVEFVPSNKQKNELYDPLSGRYILTEKFTQISQKGFSHRLKLNRDFNL